MKQILVEQFKPSDIVAAEREIVCIKDLLVEGHLDLDAAYYEGVIKRLEEAVRSAKQLLKMRTEKMHADKLIELYNQADDQNRVNEMIRSLLGHEAI